MNNGAVKWIAAFLWPVSGSTIVAKPMHYFARFTLVTLLLMLRLASVTNAATIIRGPYLQNVCSNSITVRWRTDVVTNTRLRFGTNAAALDSVMFDSLPTTEHELRLNALQPDTKYFYAIGSSDDDLGSGPAFHFTTAPGANRPVRLWVVGDTRRTIPYTSGDSRSQVRDAFFSYSSNRPPDLYFNTGDLADSGYDFEFQSALFDVYGGVFRNTPAVMCLGNHDLGVQGGQPYLDAFSLPMNGEAGGVASGTERYYSFNYSSIHFVVLDCYATNGIYTQQLEPSYRDRELAWLEQDLQSNTQRWLIAMFHSPPYTWGSHNSDAEWDPITMRTYFVPVLERFGADVLLNGHSHNYERTCLLRGHYGDSSTLTPAMKVNAGDGRPGSGGAYYKTNAQNGTVYVVMGCSGFLGPGVGGHPAMVYSANNVGSMVVDIDEDVLQARFLRDTGSVDDYFVVIKGTQPPPPRAMTAHIDSGEIHIRWEAVEGFRYQVYRRDAATAPRQLVGRDISATGFFVEWSEPLDGRTMGFYEVATLAE